MWEYFRGDTSCARGDDHNNIRLAHGKAKAREISETYIQYIVLENYNARARLQ